MLFAYAVASPAQEARPNLEKEVRAILETHCYRCHSHQSGKSRGELMVDSRALMLKGGETGPAIVLGDPEKSLLIKAVKHEDENLKMPQKGKLPQSAIDVLAAWVKAGAPWTEEPVKLTLRVPGKITDEDRKYWAFQPLSAVQPPPLDEANPIDRFILARLRHEGLKPSPPADPRALIRRLYFDVLGLPPSIAEVESFVAECKEAAQGDSSSPVTRLIDQLLASPHYGERSGRLWLDLVRFAESDGYRLDSFRPHAWRYRDYVIKSFNDDKPFDQFVREQIAGDELYPDSPEGLVAIGYLTHGIYEFNQRDVRAQWNGIVSDITDVTGEVFMGLSVGCSRCHDHKFDPILQKDYYSLRAFFDGLMPSEEVPYATAAQRREYEEKQLAWERKAEGIRQQIEAIEGPERAKTADSAIIKFPRDIQTILKKPENQRTAAEKQLGALAYRQLVFEYEKLDTRIKGAEKDRLLQLRKDLARLDADKPAPLPLCQAMREVGRKPAATEIPKKSHLGAIQPAFLTVLNQPVPSITPPGEQESSGRRATLAQWLTRPDHPLTSRVLCNRVWQQHFGQGLVATASDFGNLGDKPSHPELLDWLAKEFIRESWSIKKLHRLILTSKTYQQSALAPLDSLAMQKDSDNRLLWRMKSRRLDAEQIRDAMLAITGKLDLRVGGPSVELKEPRRSVYLKTLRNTKEPLLEVFDLPDGFGSSAQRNVTTTSTQALLLFNSPLMVQQGQALAERLYRDNITADEQRIDQAIRMAFGRPATSKEKQFAQVFLSQQAKLSQPPRDKTPSYEVARIPFHEGKAAVITPGGTQARFQLPASAKVPRDQFTLEAYVFLRSVFEDGMVRTIASHWSGDVKNAGWSFGVTGKKSAYKPQTLVLQLWGSNASDKHVADTIFSGLPLQLNRPYYVAVSVNLNDTGDKGITFYLKDLANDEEPLLVYSTTHKVVKLRPTPGAFAIGGTLGKLERSWDGMIDDVRLSNAVLSQKRLLLTSDAMSKDTVAFWQFEQAPGMLQDSSPNRLTLERHSSAGVAAAPVAIDASRAAWIDFCQVLLNANEFFYVD